MNKVKVLLIAASSIGLISACGQKSGDTPNQAAAPTQEVTANIDVVVAQGETTLEAGQVALETITPTADYVVAPTKVIAVSIHADWCSKCKTLEPKIKAVQAAGAFDDLEFASLDYTAKDEAAFFAAADEAGYGEAIRAQFVNGVKTGQVILINAADNTVVDKITSDLDNATIVAKMTSAIEAS